MQNNFKTVRTQSFSKKDSDEGVFIKQYQLIKNTETNETSVGLVFENISDKSVSSADIRIKYNVSGEEKTKEITSEIIEGEAGKVCPARELYPLGSEEITEITLGVVKVNYGEVNKKSRPQVLSVQSEGKGAKKGGKKKKVLIIVLAVVALVCAAAGVILLVSPDSNKKPNGIGTVTGKGDLSYAETAVNNDNKAETTIPDLKSAGGHDIAESDQTVSVSALPDVLTSFLNGHFYLSGKIYSVSTGETDTFSLAVDGSNHFMTEDKNGVKIGVCSFGGKNYYVNVKNSTRLEVTNELMQTLGMTADDFKLKIFDMSLVKDYKLYAATIDSEAGFCLDVTYSDGYSDRVYYVNDTVAQINVYDAQSRLLESIICDGFDSKIPDNMQNVDSYKAVDSYEEFFNSLAE